MDNTPHAYPFHRRAVVAATLAALLAGLAGCYVVPVDPRTGQPYPPAPPAGAAVAPPPISLPVRLYPANEQASRHGMVSAVVSNDLHGKGAFTASIGGESFVGEATRKAESREGVASGAGNRGAFLNCAYTMSTATQGTGQCRLSDGALFTMHIGG